MVSTKYVVAACAVVCGTGVVARPQYQDEIPNGKNVKDGNGNSWPGVGHIRSAGGGARNPFGEDFAEAGNVWTKDLCMKDSDGDGFTNGEELGDPECNWKKGDTPQFSSYITNPGDNGDRVARVDTCADATKPSGYTQVNVTFDTYTVLTESTTYVKQAFPIDATGELLVTRIAPIIDKHEVVHHMLLYACTTSMVTNYLEPNPLGGMPCSELVYAWAVGGGPFCLPDNVALVIDADEYSHLMLEIHYDNPTESDAFVDSSGLELDITPKSLLPDFKIAGYFWVGIPQSTIAIPPGQSHYHIQGGCTIPNGLPSQGVEVFATVLHAHKRGRKVYTTKKASGATEEDVSFCNPRYDFDLQEFVTPEKPVKIYSGDHIEVNCIYDTVGLSDITKGGDETANEMCISISMYYPKLGSTGRCWAKDEDRKVFQEDPSSSSICEAKTTSQNVQLENVGVFGGLPSWAITHAILMILAWVVIFPLGITFPILFRTRNAMESRWFLAHRVVMALGLVLVIAAVSLAISNKTVHFASNHSKLGLASVGLALQQPILAICRPHKNEEGSQSVMRRIWQFCHHGLGRLAILCAAGTIYLGFSDNVGTAAAGNAALAVLVVVGIWSVGSLVSLLMGGTPSTTQSKDLAAAGDV